MNNFVIYFKNIDDYIKINFSTQTIDIKCGNFFSKGPVSFDRNAIQNLKEELLRCVNCEEDEFSKSIITSSDKFFGIELRCDEREEVLLIGEYRDSETSGNMLEFEFLITKNVLKKIIEEIENHTARL